MYKAKHVVMHSTNEYPSGLKTAQETSAHMKDVVTAERIVELAEAGFLPHYRVDGQGLLFYPPEVKQWVAKNLLKRCDGQAFPSEIRVVGPYRHLKDQPPIGLASIVNLQQIDLTAHCPGIYFLCLGREVVYVGQSVSPMARIASHMCNGKEFDRVYFLPAPSTELNNLEGAFIRSLEPAQQGRSSRGSVIGPTFTGKAEDVLAPYTEDRPDQGQARESQG